MPKAFIPCAGRELWEWSADVLARACDRVVFAVPADRADAAGGRARGDAVGGTARADAAGGPARADAVGGRPRADAARPADDPRPASALERVAGGAARSESVRNALLSAPGAEIVVIHDAARPLVTEELVRRCVECVEQGADGAIAAAPITDTVKEADADGRVTRTLDRRRLWSIQTPQAFRAEILRRALDSEAIGGATDDASLVEAIGGDVRIVEAPAQNFKVTWPEDLERAESLLC